MVAFHKGLLAKWINIDEEILLGDHLLVADVHPVLDELLEVRAVDDPQAVHDVLPRPLLHLLLRREEVAHLRVLGGELQDILHRQRLIIGDGKMLDVSVLDNLKRD